MNSAADFDNVKAYDGACPPFNPTYQAMGEVMKQVDEGGEFDALRYHNGSLYFRANQTAKTFEDAEVASFCC